jgi:hypothetical protein
MRPVARTTSDRPGALSIRYQVNAVTWYRHPYAYSVRARIQAAVSQGSKRIDVPRMQAGNVPALTHA